MGEARESVLHIKSQLGGGRGGAPLHVVLKGLLICEVLEAVKICLGPLVNATGGAPHVLCVEQKQLQAAHVELRDTRLHRGFLMTQLIS